MARFYKVLKDTFIWIEGAIISDEENEGNFVAVDDIFNRVDAVNGEYISGRIVKDPENKDFFQRVYKVNKLARTVYLAKDEASKVLAKAFKD